MYRLMLILIVAASYTFSHPISSESEDSDRPNSDINLLDGDNPHSKEREEEIEKDAVEKEKHIQKDGTDHIADFIEMIGKKILKYVKHLKEKSKNSVSFRRSKAQDAIQPDIVYFDKKKPSVVLQVDTKAVVNMVADALKTNSVQSAISNVARRAAEAYNDLKEKKML